MKTAIQSVTAAPSRATLRAALKSAYELLAKCGGTSLGIAMSGANHPNPDEKLTELFTLCNVECQAITRLIGEQP